MIRVYNEKKKKIKRYKINKLPNYKSIKFNFKIKNSLCLTENCGRGRIYIGGVCLATSCLIHTR